MRNKYMKLWWIPFVIIVIGKAIIAYQDWQIKKLSDEMAEDMKSHLNDSFKLERSEYGSLL